MTRGRAINGVRGCTGLLRERRYGKAGFGGGGKKKAFESESKPKEIEAFSNLSGGLDRLFGV